MYTEPRVEISHVRGNIFINLLQSVVAYCITVALFPSTFENSEENSDAGVAHAAGRKKREKEKRPASDCES